MRRFLWNAFACALIILDQIIEPASAGAAQQAIVFSATAIGIGMLVGGGIGAGTAAATGGDPLKGALFGAVGGGLTGGLSGAFGGAGGAAGGSGGIAGGPAGGISGGVEGGALSAGVQQAAQRSAESIIAEGTKVGATEGAKAGGTGGLTGPVPIAGPAQPSVSQTLVGQDIFSVGVGDPVPPSAPSDKIAAAVGPDPFGLGSDPFAADPGLSKAEIAKRTVEGLNTAKTGIDIFNAANPPEGPETVNKSISQGQLGPLSGRRTSSFQRPQALPGPRQVQLFNPNAGRLGQQFAFDPAMIQQVLQGNFRGGF